MAGKRGRQSGREKQKKSKKRNQMYVMPTEFDLHTAEKDVTEDRRREVVKKRKTWMR